MTKFILSFYVLALSFLGLGAQNYVPINDSSRIPPGESKMEYFQTKLLLADSLRKAGDLDAAIVVANLTLEETNGATADTILGGLYKILGYGHISENAELAAQSFTIAGDYFAKAKNIGQEAACRYNRMITFFYYMENKEPGIASAKWVLSNQQKIIKIGSSNLVCGAYYELGKYFYALNELIVADSLTQLAADCGQEYRTPLHNIYYMAAKLAMDLGDVNKSLILTDSLLVLAKREKDLMAMHWAYNLNYIIYQYLDEKELVIENLRNAVDVAKAMKDRDYEVQNELNLYMSRLESKGQYLGFRDSSLNQIIDSVLAYKNCETYDLLARHLSDLIPYTSEENLKKWAKGLIQMSSTCDAYPRIEILTKAVLADIHLSNNEIDAAFQIIEYLQKNSPIEDIPKENQMSFMKVAEKVHFANGSIRKALEFENKIASIQDSLDARRRELIMSLIKEQKNRSQQVLLLEKENQIYKAELERRRIAIVLVVTLIGLSIIIIRLQYKKHRIQTKQVALVGQIVDKAQKMLSRIQQNVVSIEANPNLDKVLDSIEGSLKKIKGGTLGSSTEVGLLSEILDKQEALNLHIEAKKEKKIEDLQYLSYAVSHDLNRPINNLEKYLFLLKETLKNTERVDLLDVNLSMVKETKQMIQAISSLSKLENNMIEKETINLEGLLKNLIIEFQDKYTFKFKVDAFPMVEGDFVLLKQVFTNLIGNAVKFTAKVENPFIHISGQSTGRYHEIKIIDNGAGFDPQMADQIFKLFRSAHSRSEFDGTGVGLAIVKNILEAHNGKVEAFSLGKGQGATFTVFLPVH